MLFFKQVLDKRRLLLAPMQMAAHGGDHFGSVGWSALAQGVGLDVLVEQLIGVKLGAVAHELTGHRYSGHVTTYWRAGLSAGNRTVCYHTNRSRNE